MIRGLKIALLMLFSVVEIRVKASSAQECVPEGRSCVLKVTERVFDTAKGEHKVTFFRGSLSEKTGSQWKLLRGTARVEAKNLGTVYGVLESEGGEAWVLDPGDSRITVRSIENVQKFKLADGREIEIPEGHELWIGGRGEGGKNTFGLPVPVEIADHLKTVARATFASKEQLRELSTHLKELWKDRIRVTSEVYELSATRYLASVEEEQAARQRKIDARNQERDKYRALMHSIVFEK